MRQRAALLAVSGKNPNGYCGWLAGTFAPPEGEVWQDFADRAAKVTLASSDQEKIRLAVFNFSPSGLVLEAQE